MNRIGLTGGIGSGKSTVAARFASLGACVVDTDDISRSLTAKGGAALPALRDAFGDAYFSGDGALDRDAMRTLAFEDPAARARLESVLHPAIRAAADEALSRARGPYAILVVPLLFETRGYLDRVCRTLVVDCAQAVQLERTMARSKLPAGAVRAIMEAQWPRWRRLQMADDVIWNGGDVACIDAQCELLHGFYCTIPANPRRDL
ncbi:MAG TPA: dephospho-CoA kinase [Usitatibacter sp.]|nr:dephospho-CoA kinase [Usitatibacter sp.]